ncbi:START domain-containing protein [Nemorincola caseinilytica]|uniref:START domain-containing protein n=1 Tax=Nemorincola caseinilytica TaxID=2054315 RepID=A0ABP8NNV1_9BACT
MANEWQLKKSGSGINIYTKSQQASEVKVLKAEFEADGTVKQLANLLADVDKQKNWVYSTNSTRLIKRLNDNELIYYTEKAMPWPLSHRDVVMQMKWMVDTIVGTLTMNAHSIENSIPPPKGMVRVPVSKVVWKVSTIKPGTIRVEYFAEADPGGVIPAWVTNIFLTKGPYETFLNLRKQLVNYN